MKKDHKEWLVNTSIDEFRRKFRFSGANPRTQAEINKIVTMSRKINGPDSCHKILSQIGIQIGGMLQGTANGPEELASKLIEGEKGSLEDVTIKFHLRGNRLLRNAPEETRCRPDIVAYNGKRLTIPQDEVPISASTRSNTQDNATSTQGNTQSYITEDDLTWTQTEATSEYRSANDTNETGLEEAISHTVVHLLSRPDRVIVPGFFFTPTGFNLIFTGATGACHTLLEWENPEHLQLLIEFVHRIFKPNPEMLDPNIVRNTDDTFDVTLKKETYRKCKTLSLGSPLGRRTTIFETSDPRVPVIKEQYLMSPSVEYEILRHLTLLNVPGVVRLKDYEEYRPENQSGVSTVGCTIGETPRYKVRLTLRDKGVSIKESETLKQFLIRLYDTLEVAECLYLLGFLHRDYSLNNVLFHTPEAREEWQGSTFCSARHLLDPDVDRFATEVLLIDFELATERATQRDLESAGTPLYQARAAEQVAPLEYTTVVPGMPELIPEVLERYKEVLPKRLEQFRPDRSLRILGPSKGDTRKWIHELRHDVESAFWMLLLWVVIFRPSDDEEPPKIPWVFWANLTDERTRGLSVPRMKVKDETHWVHPALYPVRELLQDMAAHLDGDLHWLSKEDKCYEQMANPSYLREVFQRLILNFLFKYENEPFMSLEKHKGNRDVEEMIQQSTDLSATEIVLRQWRDRRG